MIGDPCGRVVDLIRRPYVALMRMAPGADPVPVRWYFAGPDAPFLPFGTLFYSRDWDHPDAHNEGPGEQRPWDDQPDCDPPSFSPGGPSCCVSGAGYCGSPQWWQTGVPGPDDAVVLTDEDGCAPCCPVADICWDGGVCLCSEWPLA